MVMAALSAELTGIPNLHCHMLSLSLTQRHPVELNHWSLHGMLWMRVSRRPCAVLSLGGICEATAANSGRGQIHGDENSHYISAECLCVWGIERASNQIKRMCRSFAKNTAASVYGCSTRERGKEVVRVRKRKKIILCISLTTPRSGLLIRCCWCECPPCSHRHFYVQSNWQEFQSDSLEAKH